MQLDKNQGKLRRKLARLALREAKREMQERGKATARREAVPTAPDLFGGSAGAIDPLMRRRSRTAKGQRSQTAVLEQWVEVEIAEDGGVITTLYPSNELLIESGRKMWPRPLFVYRRFHFVNGVPDIYSWATSNETLRASGGAGVQRMTVNTWLQLIEKEAVSGTGHLLPVANLPRPEERGGCDCDVCTRNVHLLE